jgi:hypothetical protein
MTALLVTVALFLVYLVIGLGVTALLPRSYPVMARLRIAPGIGISAYLIFTFALSRAGIPIRAFVYPLSAVLIIAALAGIAIRPPRLTVREIAEFVVPLFAALIVVGSPMATYGFQWLSYSNDDMANYSLRAERLSESGYLTPPPATAFIDSKDLPQLYWTMDAITGERVGVDMLLASASSAFHQNPLAMFMPFIVSGFLVLVAASSALGPGLRNGTVAMLISLAVATSPLTAFGVFYQLLGQVFGLAAMCTLTVILLAPSPIGILWSLGLRGWVVAGVAGAGFVGVYPELLPFVAISLLISIAIHLMRRVDVRPLLLNVAAASVVGFILLNAQTIPMLTLILRRLGGRENPFTTFFPYYLIPSGLANFWGLQPVAQFAADPAQSILILMGGVFTLGAIALMILLLIRADVPAAYALCGFVLFATFAAAERQAFTLYKLAMYVQPFLLAVVVGGLAWLVERRTWKLAALRRAAYLAPVALLIVLGLPSGAFYRDASDDQAASGFTEIPHATKDALLPDLGKIAERVGARPLISDTSNVSLAKMEAGYLQKNELLFPSNDFVGRFLLPAGSTFSGPAYQRRRAQALRFWGERNRSFVDAAFDFAPAQSDDGRAEFVINRRVHAVMVHSPYVVLASSARETILNRRTALTAAPGITAVPATDVRDYLTFIDTTLGSAPGPGVTRDRVSLFQLERDPYARNGTMASVGRYLLFEIMNAPGPVRLVLDVTATLNADGSNRVPPVTAVGTRRVSFHSVGRGSARLVSDPIVPKVIEGVAYVGIDMGTRGSFFPQHRVGLMRLYGNDISTDTRRVVGFIRDISAIDASAVPRSTSAALARFPADLADPNVFYSGIYEDGWIGEDVRATLHSTGRTTNLVLTIDEPLIADAEFAPSVVVEIDGVNYGTWPASLGRSTINVPTNLAVGAHTVGLHFSATQRLPHGDGRIVAGHLDYLGFR